MDTPRFFELLRSFTQLTSFAVGARKNIFAITCNKTSCYKYSPSARLPPCLPSLSCPEGHPLGTIPRALALPVQRMW